MNIEEAADKLPILFIIASIIGILVSLSFSEPSLFFFSLYIAVPLFLAGAISKTYNKDAFDNKFFKTSEIDHKYWVVLYMFFYSASIYLLATNHDRPLSYFIVICICILITLFLILSTSNTADSYTNSIILSQIILTSFNLISGVSVRYHFYTGRTDALAHAKYVEIVLSQGIGAKELGMYTSYPLWHIFVGGSNLILSNMSIHRTMFLLSAFIYSSSLLIVYILTRRMMSNNKIILLTVFFVSITPFFLIRGMSGISRSIVVVLFLLTLFILLMNYSKKISTLLATIVIFAMVLYHGASFPFLFSILILIFISERIISKSSYWIDKLPILLFFLGTISYWLYSSPEIIQAVASILYIPSSGQSSSAAVTFDSMEVLNYVQYSFYIFFIAIAGALGLKSNKLPTNVKVGIIVTLIIAPAAFPGPLLLIGSLSDANIIRFSEYTYYFIGLSTAIGFIILFKKSSPSFVYFVVIPITILLIFMSLTNDFVASDNPLIKREFYTYYLTKEEIYSINSIDYYSNSNIFLDYVAVRYLRLDSGNAHIMSVSDEKLLSESTNDLLLIRDGELSKRPISVHHEANNEFRKNPSWNTKYIEGSHPGLRQLPSSNTIYSSGNVTVYHSF